MLDILVLLQVLCVFRVTNVAAGFTYVHSFVMHAYKAINTTLLGGPRFKISAGFG